MNLIDPYDEEDWNEHDDYPTATINNTDILRNILTYVSDKGVKYDIVNPNKQIPLDIDIISGISDTDPHIILYGRNKYIKLYPALNDTYNKILIHALLFRNNKHYSSRLFFAIYYEFYLDDILKFISSRIKRFFGFNGTYDRGPS